MVRILVVAAVLWPMLLGGAVWARTSGEPALGAAVVYLAASRVCHQKPERTFHTRGVPWPVCGRCAGLYLAAPVGALIATRRRRAIPRRRLLSGLVLASVPTAVTLALEWLALAEVSNVHRIVSAVPLGAAIALVIVTTAASRPGAIE